MTSSPGRATHQRALTEAAMERTTIRSYRRFLRESTEAGSTWQAWNDHSDRMTNLFGQKFPTADPLAVREGFIGSKIPDGAWNAMQAGEKLVPRRATGQLPYGQEDMLRLLRTSTTATHGSTSLNALAAAGYPEKRWVAHHDNLVRPTHSAASGQTVSITAPFIVGGYSLMFPADPSAPAHEKENCRCVLVGVGTPMASEAAQPVATPPTTRPITDVMASSAKTNRKQGWDSELADIFETEVNNSLAGTGYRMDAIGKATTAGRAKLTFTVYDKDGKIVGFMDRRIQIDKDGKPFVHNTGLKLKPEHQGKGIASRVTTALNDYYRRAGVDRVILEANVDVGGYAWARSGFDWDVSNLVKSRKEVTSVLGRIKKAVPGNDPAMLAKLDEWSAQVAGDPANWPTPLELSELGKTAPWEVDGRQMWAGKQGMLGSTWQATRKL